MRFELKHQVQDVDEEKYDAGTTTDLCRSSIGGSVVRKRGMKGRLLIMSKKQDKWRIISVTHGQQ